jgi:DNA polymerase-3 subunit delta'
MSQLPPLVGHHDARAGLGAAFSRGDLPGSLLLHGPVGIGKQRLALWLAQRAVCELSQGPDPCDTCRSCYLASRIEHPDIHWFFPMPRPKASGGPDKLADALEDARAEELALRRSEPYRPVEPTELSGIYLAQVQTLRRLALSRPAMARRSVFIVGDAELLASQEASTEAANALLKVLEEPPPDTLFILTASDPDELLPTIRSRLLPVRLRPLPEDQVAAVLENELGISPSVARLAARLAQGSIGDQARDLLDAAIAPSPAGRLAAALATSPAGARGQFLDTLDFLAGWVRDLGAVAHGAPELIINVDNSDRIRDFAGRLPGGGRGVPEALLRIDLARGLTRFNINPQLTLACLLEEIGSALNEEY